MCIRDRASTGAPSSDTPVVVSRVVMAEAVSAGVTVSVVGLSLIHISEPTRPY